MSDRDLSNPDLRALDVNVLVHRVDLDTLTKKLEVLTEAYLIGEATGQSWFQTLRALPTLAAVDQLKLSTTLAQSPLVPKWINGLPVQERPAFTDVRGIRVARRLRTAGDDRAHRRLDPHL